MRLPWISGLRRVRPRRPSGTAFRRCAPPEGHWHRQGFRRVTHWRTRSTIGTGVSTGAPACPSASMLPELRSERRKVAHPPLFRRPVQPVPCAPRCGAFREGDLRATWSNYRRAIAMCKPRDWPALHPNSGEPCDQRSANHRLRQGKPRTQTIPTSPASRNLQ